MKYHYTGTLTGFSLPPDKEGDPPTDILLTPNTEVDLPEDFPYVQRLVAAKLLSPVEEKAEKLTGKKSGKQGEEV